MTDRLDDDIVALLAGKARRPLKLREIARGLDIGEGRYPDLKKTVRRLADEGRVYQVKGQRYALPEQINLVVGRLDVTRKGDGFVVSEARPGDADVFVRRHRMGSATHRDRVVARIEQRGRRENPEGRIIRVLDRARTEVVGTLRRGRRVSFVEPDNPRLRFEILVAADDRKDAGEGEKVVVEIDEWGDGNTSPEGHIVEVLGPPDAPGVDILSIIHAHGLDPDFNEEVEREASAISVNIEAEAKRRLDLRDRPAFTIDPVDAKDFDDALSVVRLRDDLFEIGIHIADVSHFVRPGTTIDEEAFERATSVYLVDRVIPMLPERLSNDLCSLVPDKDRLTYSVILQMDGEGRVHDYQIRKSVIRSRFRLTYQEAQALLHSEPSVDEHEDILFELQTLRRLAKVLREIRSRRGSLDFDLPEAIVELDEQGYPCDIQEEVRLDSMRLIEEFMLLANETVARHAAQLELPFVYRVHDRPATDRIEGIRGFVAACGYPLARSNGRLEPKDLADLLQRVRGKPEEELINTVILRSMKQARYQVENVGHFGLASAEYTHFTSPIRRYPDLVIHRLLHRAEKGERWKDPKKRQRFTSKLERTSEHASVQERMAVQAERDSVDLKKVEFMERHVGDEFDGKISGVTAFGVFIRLDAYFVEGLIHMHELDDDYYEYQEEKFALVGRNTGRRFRLADPVRVRVISVNKDLRQIDFELVAEKGKS